MKNRILIISLLVLNIVAPVCSQSFTIDSLLNRSAVGLKVGVNFPSLSYTNPNLVDYKNSILGRGMFGLYLETVLNKNLSIRPELLFVGKGQKIENIGISYEVKSNYFEIRMPVMYTYKHWQSFSSYVLLGPTMSFATGGKISFDNLNTNISKANMSPFDVGGILGLGVKVPLKIQNTPLIFTGEIAYNHGFMNTYGVNEKNGTAVALNHSSYIVDGIRLNNGLEFSVSLAIPLRKIKTLIPPKKKHDPVIVPDTIPVIKEKIRHQVEIKESNIQDQLEEYLDKLQKDNQISKNLQTSVNVTVVNEPSATGVIEQNLHAKYNYEILKDASNIIKSQIDDYPAGKYKLGSSKAAMSTMQILKQTVEKNLSEFLSKGAKVTVKITGTTDASQVKGTIPYLNDYGDIELFTYFINNQLSSVSVSRNSGVTSNEQLGLLRTYGVRQFIETYIEPLKNTQNSFEHYVETTNEIGGKNRRVSIELVVHDAFKNYTVNSKENNVDLKNNKSNSIAIKSEQNKIKPLDRKSDVDINIPQTKSSKENVYALVIGNEDYSSEQIDLNSEINVDYAVNDATIFRDYCVQTLGIKEEHVTLLKNATAAKMNRAISKIESISDILKDKMEIVVYFSGHGLPDEQTKDAYIIPVDVSGTDIKSAIKVDDLYKRITKNSPKRATVFLDACFSGGGRNKGLLSLKGVKVKPKEEELGGNLVVFTSSSGEESSTVYKEKQHGLFTYFLLKKLQETKGDLTYKDLADYISGQVKLQSVVVNNKNQTPTTLGSESVFDKWGNWKLK